MVKGVAGKVLFVNLSDSTSRVENIADEAYENYLSGLGLGVRILYYRIPAGADPLGPQNVIGFMAGLLTGIGVMFGGRFLVVGKSPLTNGWGDSNCGGNLVPAIKQSGFDGIFFEGAASDPVYVHVNNGQVEIVPAGDLWGLDTVETEDKLIERHGGRARVACIGPAGEHLVRFAGISNERGRMAGRSGLGAVMGSKKLKALVLEGTNKVQVADQATLKKWSKSTSALMPKGKGGMPAWAVMPLGWLMSKMKTSFRLDGLMSLPAMSQWGTNSGNEISILNGDGSVRNWRGDPSMYPSRVVGLGKIEATQLKKYHCTACPLGCGAITSMKGHSSESHRPEYETVTVFGANLLNRNLDSIYDINDYCNRAGLDSISTGSVVAFAIECFEQGFLTPEMTGGQALSWGNTTAIKKLVEDISYRRGVGNLLADGVRLASEKIGEFSQRFAFHAGGEELPMHDPRIDPAYGVLYISDPTPGRHTITNETEYQMFNLWKRVSWAPEPPITYPKSAKYLNSDMNAKKNAAGSMHKALLDCAGLCLIGAHIGVDRSGLFEMLNAVTGFSKTPDEYMVIGRRVQDLRQWFNIKHGIEPTQVTINPLVTGHPPASKGPARGLEFDVYAMRGKFWSAMGWNKDTGYPTQPPEEIKAINS